MIAMIFPTSFSMIRKRCVLNRVFEKLLWNEKWRMVIARRVAPALHVALPGCPSFLLGPRPPGRGDACLKTGSGTTFSGGSNFSSILIFIARSALCDDAIWFSTAPKNECRWEIDWRICPAAQLKLTTHRLRQHFAHEGI